MELQEIISNFVNDDTVKYKLIKSSRQTGLTYNLTKSAYRIMAEQYAKQRLPDHTLERVIFIKPAKGLRDLFSRKLINVYKPILITSTHFGDDTLDELRKHECPYHLFIDDGYYIKKKISMTAIKKFIDECDVRTITIGTTGPASLGSLGLDKWHRELESIADFKEVSVY